MAYPMRYVKKLRKLLFRQRQYFSSFSSAPLKYLPNIFRYIRTSRYKLIHNLNYWSPFPIDQDFYLSPTFLDLLQRSHNNDSLHWYKPSLQVYYQRPEYEVFDLKVDPEERFNVAQKASYQVRDTRSALG